MIIVKDIHKSYGSLEVLKGISLEVEKGEIISIVGASGAGKSTLLHIIGTLDRADAGTIEMNEVNVLKLSDKKLAAFRNKNIGFVFQFHHLLPEFTALENICIPGFLGRRNKREVERKALDLLNFMGLKERSQHKPNELSGGEQQRVAVARALLLEPRVVFADEPTGNLDTATGEALFRQLMDINDKQGVTFIIVTHNESLSKRCHRVIEMVDGRLLNR